jgi:DNA mismatch repair protein MutL
VPEKTGRGYLGVFDTYLLYQSGEELVLVDQHALHERVLYERMRRELRAGTVVRQGLLVPEVVEVGRDQVLRLEEQGDALARLGLELTPMGDTSVAVHAVPALLTHRRVEELVWSALSAGEGDEALPLEERLHTLACHAAVRAGDRLEAAQIESLLAEAAGLPEAKACPHGRPTSIRLARSDLERWFKRSGF